MNLLRRVRTGLTIVLLPGDGGESTSLTISARGVRGVLVGVILLAAAGLAVAGSWGLLALRAARAVQLEARVDSLEAERERILGLAEEISLIEREYEHLRSLFGPSETGVSQDLWLPPSGFPAGKARVAVTHADLPTSWPLTEPGFVTQGLFAGDSGDHPGLDIAVGSGSYVRAAGAGTVVRVGEDAAYGLFVVLQHGEGYQSVYGHASMILVERGMSVRQNEVIALSGSTGQSTAPHLHFEILLDGSPVDPLTMVEQPG